MPSSRYFSCLFGAGRACGVCGNPRPLSRRTTPRTAAPSERSGRPTAHHPGGPAACRYRCGGREATTRWRGYARWHCGQCRVLNECWTSGRGRVVRPRGRLRWACTARALRHTPAVYNLIAKMVIARVGGENVHHCRPWRTVRPRMFCCIPDHMDLAALRSVVPDRMPAWHRRTGARTR